MKVLTIIVTYNGTKWIEKCIQSVMCSNVKSDCIIIDNGSRDGCQEIIKSFSNVIFVQSKENLGFGKANNIGIRYAIDNDYDYIYLLNQDAYLFQDTIENLIRVSEEYPEYGILSPIQMQANQRHFDANFVQSIIQSDSCKQVLEDFQFGGMQDIYPVPDVLAANWLITRRCFTKVGGFSPSFPHYGEDNNYCQRALYHKFSIGIVPSAKAIHDTEYRKNSAEKEMYLIHMYNISLINNIYNPHKCALFRTLTTTARAVLLFKSFIPIKNEAKILTSFFSHIKNRNTSKKNGAFLDHVAAVVV